GSTPSRKGRATAGSQSRAFRSAKPSLWTASRTAREHAPGDAPEGRTGGGGVPVACGNKPTGGRRRSRATHQGLLPRRRLHRQLEAIGSSAEQELSSGGDLEKGPL